MSRRMVSNAFSPRNRLAKIFRSDDLRSFGELVESGNREMRRIAATAGAGLDRDVEVLIDTCTGSDTDLLREVRMIELLLLKIIESARLTNRIDLAAAAQGVWELIDNHRRKGVWHHGAFAVHLTALKTLCRRSGLQTRETFLVMNELKALRAALDSSPARDMPAGRHRPECESH